LTFRDLQKLIESPTTQSKTYKIKFPFKKKHVWVKKSSKFDLPGLPTDSHGNVIRDNTIPIVVIDSPTEPSYRKQKLPASYEALEKAGFKFTSY
jgi:hypothetical protein